MARAPAIEKWLIFVDTNVLLDFYRLGGESADRALKALEKHKDSIIINDQVYMEFLKNRQKVIIDSLKQFSKPSALSAPPIIAERQYFKTLQKDIKKAQSQFNRVKESIEGILLDPSHRDPVFQSINRIYGNDGKFNLKRPNKSRIGIRNLARKRFILGYPPRKREDTSMGDAVNWETIIHCASISDEYHNVLIVSRDGDYGTIHTNIAVLNDWLRREFKERISKKRKIELTNRLTLALKRLDEIISAEDEAEEDRILGGAGANPNEDYATDDEQDDEN